MVSETYRSLPMRKQINMSHIHQISIWSRNEFKLNTCQVPNGNHDGRKSNQESGPNYISYDDYSFSVIAPFTHDVLYDRTHMCEIHNVGFQRSISVLRVGITWLVQRFLLKSVNVVFLWIILSLQQLHLMFLHFGLVFSGVRHLLLIHPDIALFLMLKERITRFLFENSIHSITL